MLSRPTPAAAMASYCIPVIFFLLLIPFDYILPVCATAGICVSALRSTLRAIWASSVMFAAVHSCLAVAGAIGRAGSGLVICICERAA